MDGAQRVKLLTGLLGRLDRDSRIALGLGVALAVVAIFINPLLALAIGAVGAVLVAFIYPDSPIKVGILVVVPVMAIAYLAGLLRGFSSTVLLIFLVPAFIAPIWLARVAADVRTGRRDKTLES